MVYLHTMIDHGVDRSMVCTNHDGRLNDPHLNGDSLTDISDHRKHSKDMTHVDDEIVVDATSLSPANCSKDTVTESPKNLVTEIDYATTYSGVAYALPSSGTTKLDGINVVQDWGLDLNHEKIPSTISYPDR